MLPMQESSTLNLNLMLKKSIVSLALVGVVALALASSGGGDRKKAAKLVTPEFTPIKTSTGFSMRSGISYSGSLITSAQKVRNSVNLRTLATFQKGNNIYIVPNAQRITTVKTQKTNLNLLDLRINLHK